LQFSQKYGRIYQRGRGQYPRRLRGCSNGIDYGGEIMKIEVRYLSKSGNTAKVAEAIANTVNATAKPIKEPASADTDLLFLGGAVYAFGIDEELKKFIAALPKSVKVAVFSTTAVVKSSFPHIKKCLDEHGIAICAENFHCRGEFKFMHKGRPNADVVMSAAEFAKRVADNVKTEAGMY
jgi:flavodoxin